MSILTTAVLILKQAKNFFDALSSNHLRSSNFEKKRVFKNTLIKFKKYVVVAKLSLKLFGHPALSNTTQQLITCFFYIQYCLNNCRYYEKKINFLPNLVKLVGVQASFTPSNRVDLHCWGVIF